MVQLKNKGELEKKKYNSWNWVSLIKFVAVAGRMDTFLLRENNVPVIIGLSDMKSQPPCLHSMQMNLGLVRQAEIKLLHKYMININVPLHI